MNEYNKTLKQILQLKQELKNPDLVYKDTSILRKQISILQNKASSLIETTNSPESQAAIEERNTKELFALKEKLKIATGEYREQLQQAYNNLLSKIEYERTPKRPDSAPYQPPYQSNLTSFYKLNESIGTREDSKGRINLNTIIGSPTSVTGKIGNALGGLTGSEYLYGPGAIAIYNGLSKLSINYWAYLDITAGAFNHSFSIGNGCSVRHQGNGTTGVIDWRCTVTGNKVIVQKSGILIPGGSWKMYTVTYDGSLSNNSIGTWYLDGVLQDNGGPAAGIPTTLTITNDNLYLGSDLAGGQPMTGGVIDLFSTYAGYVLTPGDVSALYNEGVGRDFPTTRFF